MKGSVTASWGSATIWMPPLVASCGTQTKPPLLCDPMNKRQPRQHQPITARQLVQPRRNWLNARVLGQIGVTNHLLRLQFPNQTLCWEEVPQALNHCSIWHAEPFTQTRQTRKTTSERPNSRAQQANHSNNATVMHNTQCTPPTFAAMHSRQITPSTSASDLETAKTNCTCGLEKESFSWKEEAMRFLPLERVSFLVVRHHLI